MVRPLEALVGQEVLGIAFVRRDVELLVGSAVVRGFGPPSISIGAACYRFPLAGSRDAFCFAIGSTITAVEAVEGGGVELRTSNDCHIRLPGDGCFLELVGA
ncbi:MAG: hypothetical protein ACOY4R_14995 [Pseudomonadota bacterium]